MTIQLTFKKCVLVSKVLTADIFQESALQSFWIVNVVILNSKFSIELFLESLHLSGSHRRGRNFYQLTLEKFRGRNFSKVNSVVKSIYMVHARVKKSWMSSVYYIFHRITVELTFQKKKKSALTFQNINEYYIEWLTEWL